MEQITEFFISYTPWVITYGLIIAGLAGAFIPVIPSHLIILLGGVSHYFMLRPDSGLGIVSFVVMGLLLVGSQIFETMSGSMGSKWFGGTKWGTFGAMTGLMVGLFFAPYGFILGPLIGALAFEKLFGKQSLKEATSSGVGSAVGTLTGLLMRLIVAFVMSAYLLVDIYLLK